MDDYISRQAALDIFDDYNVAVESGQIEAYSRDRKRLCDLPPAQPEQRWIPVTERLPKFGTTVLITNEKGNVRCGRFRGVEFWKDGGDAYWTFKGNTVEHVLAWMPLPKPWEGEE